MDNKPETTQLFCVHTQENIIKYAPFKESKCELCELLNLKKKQDVKIQKMKKDELISFINEKQNDYEKIISELGEQQKNNLEINSKINKEIQLKNQNIEDLLSKMNNEKSKFAQINSGNFVDKSEFIKPNEENYKSALILLSQPLKTMTENDFQEMVNSTKKIFYQELDKIPINLKDFNAFDHLVNGDKFEYVMKLFGFFNFRINPLNSQYENLLEEIKNQQSELSLIKYEIKSLNNEKTLLLEMINSLKNDTKNLEFYRNVLDNDILVKSDMVKKQYDKVNELRENYKKISIEILDLKSQLDITMKVKNEKNEEILKLKDDYIKLFEENKKIIRENSEKSVEIGKNTELLKKLNDEISKYNGLKEISKTNYANENQKYTKEIDKIKENYNAIKSEVDKCELDKARLVAEIRVLNQKNKDANEEFEQLNETITKIKSESSEISSQTMEIKKDLKIKEKELEKLDEKISETIKDFDDKITTAKERKDFYERKAREIEEKLTKRTQNLKIYQAEEAKSKALFENYINSLKSTIILNFGPIKSTNSAVFNMDAMKKNEFQKYISEGNLSNLLQNVNPESISFINCFEKYEEIINCLKKVIEEEKYSTIYLESQILKIDILNKLSELGKSLKNKKTLIILQSSKNQVITEKEIIVLNSKDVSNIEIKLIDY